MAWRGSFSRMLLSTARSASLRRPPAPPLPRLRPPYAPLIRHFSNPRNLGEFAGSTLTSRIAISTRAFRGLSNEIEETMADYVHQEMTRNLILVFWRLFLLIVIKDAFLFLFGEQNFKEQKPLVMN